MSEGELSLKRSRVVGGRCCSSSYRNAM